MKRPLSERLVVLACELGQAWHTVIRSAATLTRQAVRTAFVDTRAETPRAAPSFSKCGGCGQVWTASHDCPVPHGTPASHACSPTEWSAERGGWVCLCGKAPADDWYVEWRKANP